MKCARCGGALAHELFRLTVFGPTGEWPLCPPCAGAFILDLQRAHRRAGELLEQWFQASA